MQRRQGRVCVRTVTWVAVLHEVVQAASACTVCSAVRTAPVMYRKLVGAAAHLGVSPGGGCVCDYRDLVALLEQLAQVALDVQVRRHPCEDLLLQSADELPLVVV